MKTYNVLISVPVEYEMAIPAESEECARAIAIAEFSPEDIQRAEYMSTGEPEAVESWELEEE